MVSSPLFSYTASNWNIFALLIGKPRKIGKQKKTSKNRKNEKNEKIEKIKTLKNLDLLALIGFYFFARAVIQHQDFMVLLARAVGNRNNL